MTAKISRLLLRSACLLALIATLAVSVTALSPKSYNDRENIANVEEFMDDQEESAQQYHFFNPLSWLSTEEDDGVSTILHSQSHRQLGSSSSKKKHHKHLLPLDNTDKLGFFFATLGLMIAAGGGIGGGGVLVPIYILIMKFSPKHAVSYSLCIAYYIASLIHLTITHIS